MFKFFKTNYKIFLLEFSVILYAFLILVGYCSASEVQFIDMTPSSNEVYSHYNQTYPVAQTLNKHTKNKSNISKIVIMQHFSTTATGTCQLLLCSGTAPDLTPGYWVTPDLWNCGYEPNNAIALISQPSTSQYQTFSFESPIKTNPNLEYWFQYSCTPKTGTYNRFEYTHNPDAYFQTQMDLLPDDYMLGSTDRNMMFFDTYYDTSIATMTPAEMLELNDNGFGLQLIYPTSDKYPFYTLSAIGTELYNFRFTYALGDTNFNNYSIRYWTTITEDFSVTSMDYTKSLSSLDVSSSSYFTLPISVIEGESKFYQFQIFDNYNNSVKASTDIYINWYNEKIATTTNNESLGFWGDIFKTMFVPSTKPVAKFQSLAQVIEYKPPFGYLYLLTDEYNNLYLSTSTPTINGVALSMPLVFVTLFHTVFMVIISLTFLAYIFFRIKNLHIW